jgi:menaquinone-dependent protoporphyrinogen IX oxidase
MGAIQMVPMAHKMISRYKWNKQLTNFLMDMMGKESVSQREMEYTFIINRSK